MPQYARTVGEDKYLIEFKCSWKVIPETIAQLRRGIKRGIIQPILDVSVDDLLESISNFKPNEKLIWSKEAIKHQKPSSHLINWIPIERL